MPDLVAFGELMLRLTTPNRSRFSQAQHLDVTFGGAEANVAVAAALLGARCSFITRMPENELADRALCELRGLGVDVSGVVRGGDRLGVYFLEQGAGHRAGKVIYDRARSSIAEALPEHFDWAPLLTGARWFHWSGITTALSPAAPQVLRKACEAARAAGAKVSFDLNYRAKLWTPQQAKDVLEPLLPLVDLCVTSADEARTIFGLELPADPAEHSAAAAAQLRERFGIPLIALSERRAGTAETTEWGAALYTEGKCFRSQRYTTAIVDRLGAGDSFTGTLLFALLRGDELQRALELAAAASTLKHSVEGDYNLVSLQEVEALAGGASGGRVRR